MHSPLLICTTTFLLVICATSTTESYPHKLEKSAFAFPTNDDSGKQAGPTLPIPTVVDDGGPTLPIPSIIYESDRVIAINKPHGISHHDDVASGTPGILSLIRHLQSSTSGSGHSFPFRGRIFGVHRLDRATSGILLLAKDSKTARELTECFREKTVIKYYVAITTKKPKKGKQGWVKGDMIRGRRGAWMLKKTTNNPAVTRFFTAGLGSLASDVVSETGAEGRDAVIPRTAILFRPHTGRTHQLRVAAKSLGLPILNDPYYGDGTAAATIGTRGRGSNITASSVGPSDTLQRTYLHATALHVALGDENVTIWCPPPFGGLWREDNVENTNESSGETVDQNRKFDEVIVGMMRKNCECEEILKAVNDYAKDTE